MLFILSIVAIFFLFCFWNTSYGACAYIAVRLLIPAQIRMAGLNTSLNTFLLFILLLFCLRDIKLASSAKLEKDIDYFKNIVLFISLITITIPFGIVNNKVQISALTQTVITEILPSICILLTINSTQSLKNIIYTFLVCTIITSIYGLFSYIVGSNPYYMYMITRYGDVDALTYYFDELEREKGALRGFSAGMATGGALKWSQIVLLSSVFLFVFRDIINKRLWQMVFLLLFINCFLTGQRAAFLSLLVSLAYIFLNRMSLEKVLIALAIPVVLIMSVEMIPSLDKLKTNLYSTIMIWDDSYAKKNKVGGSSFNMRIEQADATMSSLIENPMGKGYSYYKVYHEKFGNHGVMRGFESIFFKAGWESGFIGLIAWWLLFLGCYKYNIDNGNWKNRYVKAFYIGYISTIIMTGIQTTLYLFLIQVILIQKYKSLLNPSLDVHKKLVNFNK